MEEGMVENFILSALHTYSKDGVVLIMLATHVGDCLWGNLPEVEHIMEKIRQTPQFGKLGEDKFRFCGLEVVQDKDFSIKVTCEETTRKMKPIFMPPHRKTDVDSPCTHRRESRSVERCRKPNVDQQGLQTRTVVPDI